MAIFFITAASLKDDGAAHNSFLFLVSGAGILVCWGYAAWYVLSVKPKQVAGWKQVWHCNRCGNIYHPEHAFAAYDATKVPRRLYSVAAMIAIALCVPFAIVMKPQPTVAASPSKAGAPSATYARASHTINPRYRVNTVNALPVVSQGKAMCTVDQGAQVPAEKITKTNVANIVMATSYIADLCQNTSDPRDVRHQMTYQATKPQTIR